MIMGKYTERLDIKMTSQDMCILAAASLKAGKPLTVYARDLILNQINPMMRETAGEGECDRPYGKR